MESTVKLKIIIGSDSDGEKAVFLYKDIDSIPTARVFSGSKEQCEGYVERLRD